MRIGRYDLRKLRAISVRERNEDMEIFGFLKVAERSNSHSDDASADEWYDSKDGYPTFTRCAHLSSFYTCLSVCI